jgi:hypothetical protein
VGAYRQLALHTGLVSGDTHIFAAACYELAHLLRIGFAVSSKQTRLALAEDCVAMCVALGTAPACSAATAAAQAVVAAATAVLPRDKGHAVSVAFRDAAVAQRRRHKRDAAHHASTSGGVVLEDVLFFVLSQCDARTLAAAACTSRSWRACATSPALWRVHAELLLSQVKGVAGPSSSSSSADSSTRDPVDWYARFVTCAAQQRSGVQAAMCPRVVCSRCWRVGWRHLEGQPATQQGGMQVASRRVPCGRRSGHASSSMGGVAESHKWAGASPEHAAHATLRRYDVPCTAWNEPHDSPTGGDRSGDGVYISERRLWSFPHLAAAHAASA